MNRFSIHSSLVRRALLLCGILLSLAQATRTQAQAPPEHAVKAAFLYRFTDYVQWPLSALQTPVFTIAVLDDRSVAADLEHILAGRRIKNMPAQVRLIHRPADIADAQMLFVGTGDADAHRRMIDKLAGRAMLIVTDEDRGLDEGGAVNFMLIDRRVRFEISLITAGEHGLRISSELLSVAARVEGHLSTGVEPAATTGVATLMQPRRTRPHRE